MDKLLAILMAALLLIGLTACGGSGDTDSSIDSSAPEISAPDSASESDAPASTSDRETTTTTSGKGSPSVTKKTDAKQTSTTTTAAASVAVPNEDPFTGNSAILWDEQHSSYDAKAEAKRQSILKAKDTVKPVAGKTFYISYKGNDSNDGRSPATAWRSTDRVGLNPAIIPDGSVILFERGGVYRGTMKVRSGMSIGAYGSGPKPQLYAGPRNYADESLWTKTNTANVWRLSVGTKMGDIGNIIFDHGKECSGPGKKMSADKLKKDYDFYHNMSKGYIYLYLAKGNPAALHDSIEVAPDGALIHHMSSGQKNIVIDNLCIKYSNFGIGGSEYKNITITNCEIGWIGGSLTEDKTVRYGNGIELFNSVEGARIENNWIYQCYDAGYTNQGHRGIENNITVTGNLIEYCNYNIEVFMNADSGGKVTNTVYEKNILRFAGYGFGSYARWGSDTSQVGHIRNSLSKTMSENFVIRNNVFDCSAYQLVNSGWCDGVNGPSFTGNTWIQNDAEKAFAAYVRKSTDANSPSKLPAGNQATMEESVAIVDKNATVIFEKKK